MVLDVPTTTGILLFNSFSFAGETGGGWEWVVP